MAALNWDVCESAAEHARHGGFAAGTNPPLAGGGGGGP